VNGIEGASLCLSGMDMQFVSAMNSTVFILGVGTYNELGISFGVFIAIPPVSLFHVQSLIPNTKMLILPLLDLLLFILLIKPPILNMWFCLCLQFEINSYTGGGYRFFCSFNRSSSMLLLMNNFFFLSFFCFQLRFSASLNYGTLC
jgi:hypothetical protein